MGLDREIETVGGIGVRRMLAGIALVGAVAAGHAGQSRPRSDPVAREEIALAPSVVLIGLLMMVTRSERDRARWSGSMSLENGINLAATGARGMPLVVEHQCPHSPS